MPNKLRTDAEERIKGGTAPLTRGWPTGAPALTLLHALASVPETASDALKLLHELQVHQVELDLQHEQTEQDLRQLTEDLTVHTDLFDMAPFAYLALEPDGFVIAANRLAMAWLAPETAQGQEVTGHRIEDLLAPECRSAIQHLLAALRDGEGRQTCPVQCRENGASAQAVATTKAGGGQVLIAFMPAVQ